jgi:release factor glutamine methyltransferase
VARRAEGEPVAYLTGHKAFMGLDLLVDRRVLLVRPSTRWLVEAALECARLRPAAPGSGGSGSTGSGGGTGGTGGGGLLVADVGTGCGAVALALGVLEPRIGHIYAVDTSADALAVARANGARYLLNVLISWLEGDTLGPVPEPVDLIVANLPYLRDVPGGAAPEVLRYEPHAALFSGADGLGHLRRLIAQAPAKLRPGGALICALDDAQRPAVAALLAAALPSPSCRRAHRQGLRRTTRERSRGPVRPVVQTAWRPDRPDAHAAGAGCAGDRPDEPLMKEWATATATTSPPTAAPRPSAGSSRRSRGQHAVPACQILRIGSRAMDPGAVSLKVDVADIGSSSGAQVQQVQQVQCSRASGLLTALSEATCVEEGASGFGGYGRVTRRSSGDGLRSQFGSTRRQRRLPSEGVRRLPSRGAGDVAPGQPVPFLHLDRLRPRTSSPAVPILPACARTEERTPRTSPHQRVWACHGTPVPWGEARTSLGPGAMRVHRVALRPPAPGEACSIRWGWAGPAGAKVARWGERRPSSPVPNGMGSASRA